MQLKFVSLGLIASILASVSARSLYTDNVAGTQNAVEEVLSSRLVARCSTGCCSSSCGSSNDGDNGFDFGHFNDHGMI